MNNCYLCGARIQSTGQGEHIFLHCFGGTLRSNRLICNSCNIELGQSIDAKLCLELKSYANWLRRYRRQETKLETIRSLQPS